MSKSFVRSVMGLMACAALATSASAADSFLATADVTDFGNGCIRGSGSGIGPHPQAAGAACPDAEAGALATPGHAGVSVHASSDFAARATGTAEYQTTVVFVPLHGEEGDFIPAQLNLGFAGALGVSGSADGGYQVIVDFGGSDFFRSTTIDTGAPPSHGVMTLGFSDGLEVDNQLSAFVGGTLTTSTVIVPVNVPVPVQLHLLVGGFGNPGTFNGLFADSLDFVRGRDLFNLPDGFTAEDPDAFVFDNRFTPPGGVPEPDSWALMIAGFGLAGAMLRRRKAQAACPVEQGTKPSAVGVVRSFLGPR
jgi:hypothetical protein